MKQIDAKKCNFWISRFNLLHPSIAQHFSGKILMQNDAIGKFSASSLPLFAKKLFGIVVNKRGFMSRYRGSFVVLYDIFIEPDAQHLISSRTDGRDDVLHTDERRIKIEQGNLLCEQQRCLHERAFGWCAGEWARLEFGELLTRFSA